MENENIRRERELVLDAIQYAYVLDKTKGNIVTYVGPHKTSLSGTDEPIVFDHVTKMFRGAATEKAVQQFIRITENSYAVMENPTERAEEVHPRQGSNNSPKLNTGRKINIPGPATFPLWPTQTAQVIEGHRLRSNQYLLVRVYNEEAARQNWVNSVVKTTTGKELKADMAELTVGQSIIIKGTEVSFYMPPTGVEVVPDENGKYVRDAVTLERLEYCILLDEDGNKSFEKGPSVVFPLPTQSFIANKEGARKFRAIELSETTGLYIKVIAEYSEASKTYKPGDEMFITGKDTMIYYPRPEHAIVKYGDSTMHYAIAIPEGEGRYILNRSTGNVEMVEGPKMFLPDPRSQVIVRRVLTHKQCALMYPGNSEALTVNAKAAQDDSLFNNIRGMAKSDSLTKGASPETMFSNFASNTTMAYMSAVDMSVNESFQRKTEYTPPRTIELNTKYDGAVTVRIWTGYAVLVVSKTGQRRVEVGPKTLLLNYDEVLEPIALSTGKPKNTDKMYETVYLRVQNNKVSDIVQVETSDFVKCSMKLSYKVNFTGDSTKWFDVENYVKFLCDNMRSMLKNAVKKTDIGTFYKEHIDFIRDRILGKSETGKERPGRLFPENGMQIVDLEVLHFQIDDNKIADLLTSVQRRVTEGTVNAELQEKELELMRRTELTKRLMEEEKVNTSVRLAALQIAHLDKLEEVKTRETSMEYNINILRAQGRLKQTESENLVKTRVLESAKAEHDLKITKETEELALTLKELEAQTQASIKRAEAVSPQIINALQAFADKDLAGKMAQSMAPLAILGGRSIAEVFNQLIKGTVMENILTPLADKTTKTKSITN